MTRRVHAGGGGHVHAAWESQPLVRSTGRGQHRAPVRLIILIATAFTAGLLLGLRF